MNIHKWFTNFFHGWFLDKWEVSVGWRASSTAIQLFIHRRFSGFVVRVIEKSKILVYRQKVSFLFCFILAYSYLCNQVSARSLRGGAGMTFEENINKRLLLFGTLWNVGNFNSCTIQWINRKCLCVMHGRDLSGLTVIPTTSECGWWTSMLYFVVCNRLRR